MDVWDQLFKKRGRRTYLKIQEGMPKVIKLMKKEGAKRVLDLGCGYGRHAVLLAKAGFDVYGMDSSKEGLEMTRKWLGETGLKAKLKRASCYKKFPFKDDFFDAVISIQVIHHNYVDKVRYCVSEIERVLKPGGIAFVTVTVESYKRFATKFKNPAPRTVIPLDGREKGVPHYVYTEELMRKDFKNFEILDLHKDSRSHYCFLGRLK